MVTRHARILKQVVQHILGQDRHGYRTLAGPPQVFRFVFSFLIGREENDPGHPPGEFKTSSSENSVFCFAIRMKDLVFDVVFHIFLGKPEIICRLF